MYYEKGSSLPSSYPYMNLYIISSVINRYFAFMNELDGNNHLSQVVPPGMIDNSRPPRFENEGYVRWKPIKSTITDDDINLLETKIGFKLPVSYRYFLQHVHFIELGLGDHPIDFFRSLSENSIEQLLEEIMSFPPSLIDMEYEPPLARGYIPFANYSDQGLACFDTTRDSTIGNEYRLIWLDHEDGYQQPQPLAANFISMFHEFSTHLDQWIKNNREKID
jgi:hypothetical protein